MSVLWPSYLYNGNPVPEKTVFILRQGPVSVGALTMHMHIRIICSKGRFSAVKYIWYDYDFSSYVAKVDPVKYIWHKYDFFSSYVAKEGSVKYIWYKYDSSSYVAKEGSVKYIWYEYYFSSYVAKVGSVKYIYGINMIFVFLCSKGWVKYMWYRCFFFFLLPSHGCNMLLNNIKFPIYSFGPGKPVTYWKRHTSMTSLDKCNYRKRLECSWLRENIIEATRQVKNYISAFMFTRVTILKCVNLTEYIKDDFLSFLSYIN